MSTSRTRKETYEDGIEMRKAVLGAAHVERSLNNVTEFSRPIQELVTEYCWGAVWTREGIDRKTRSLLNLAMLTTLNRSHELAVHVRGAVTNGCSDEEIQEVLIQAAVYVGVPAALESFRVAEATLKDVRANV
ncbi:MULTISPECIES: carboxymuconolactone decarboxylase family protein [Rhodococcus]|uniref:carboxymuconolactone decarboxylase family protein n=1 Tax=Rhodococcus TaxID=1827 RepID=UPI000EAA9006|nr:MULTISPECIES: carboxymuconolactone decarboxylase family protein [Rhodococcus]NHU47764.1 4-carboxymuconolactone decarboxylase [Rhodococcus sp. A14]RZL84247.1 MAG: 4-carboxymuconolactone decarboxylase [Rhodococcus sp. (in: high G+C Gram-positive bacteria)]MDI9941299.1 carboxymuconolactone decarboxylase family protein [Rhodococcus sp. IEGM 1351]MDJ0418524.1 carboxymuconolactone decarboxylase family protein [Rhodococcus opacus]QZS59572.1 carboxymuconolactone decarboxylase family protein [Rhodoc